MLQNTVEESKLECRIMCGEYGEGSMCGAQFRKPISLFAELLLWPAQSNNSDILAQTTATCELYHFQTSVNLAPATLKCLFSHLRQAVWTHNSDQLTLTTDMHAFATLAYSLLKLWHGCLYHSDMLGFTALTYSLWPFCLSGFAVSSWSRLTSSC